jgi:hypothetical protein
MAGHDLSDDRWGPSEVAVVLSAAGWLLVASWLRRLRGRAHATVGGGA